jgi:GTPase SAR1 family protein
MKKHDLKIVISGLDNAGKTSMVMALKRMYGFEEDVKNLRPTIRIDYYRRDFLNWNLNFWDMGGQANFRELYIRRRMYFENMNLLIYLIDIQNEMRFQESIEYLGKIDSILDEVGYDKDVPIFVCFSKADYNFIQNNLDEFLSRMKQINDLVSKSFPALNFVFYATSIYTIYSIVHMISSGLQRYMKEYQEITKYLFEFGEKIGMKQILLFDHTGLVISDYFKAGSEGLEQSNEIDRIIGDHLRLFNKEEFHPPYNVSIQETDGQYLNYCYRFILYNIDQTDEEKPHELSHGQDQENPLRANYYLSVIIPKENGEQAMNDIPDAISNITRILTQILQ